LPTEAEWEHAARGDVNSIYPWGTNTFDVTLARTNRPIEEDPLLKGAKPIRSYPVGNFGLYDMAGNVSEWVYDWYAANYYNQLVQGPQPIPPNPQGPPAGTERGVRGGSWADNPFFARAVHRMSLQPGDHSLATGFRCAASADAGTTAPASTGNTGTQPIATTASSSGTTGGSEEDTANSQPTIPPPPPVNNQPTQTPPVTLAPG